MNLLVKTLENIDVDRVIKLDDFLTNIVKCLICVNNPVIHNLIEKVAYLNNDILVYVI
jgi:hypothetical protein